MRLATIGVLWGLAMAGGTNAYARSLSDALNQMTTFAGEELPPSVVAFLTSVQTSVQRNAVRSADFVAAATTPGFTYEYDPVAGAFERSSSSRGSVFVESPRTLTTGHFDLGLSYLYSEFSELDGNSLDDAFTDLASIPGGATFATEIEEFDLTSQVLSAYATYGVTANLDVNVLVPLFLTELHVHGSKVLVVDGRRSEERFDEDETKFGIGDVLVRAKYRLPDAGSFGFAGLLGLRLPSGNEDNFQGLGDVVLTPLLVAARGFGPHEVHLNLGADVNADDLERSRARYALGVAIQALPALTLLADVIGSSGLSDDDFDVPGGTGSVARSDIVDLATGFKLSLGDQFVANLGVIVPLTDDGLRADVVPTAGFELTF